MLFLRAAGGKIAVLREYSILCGRLGHSRRRLPVSNPENNRQTKTFRRSRASFHSKLRLDWTEAQRIVFAFCSRTGRRSV
jgi:hypothetical protein